MIFALAVAFTVRWVVVPLIMVGLLLFGRQLAHAPAIRHSEKRLSARAGWYAGILLALIYLIANLGNIDGPDMSFNAGLPDFRFLALFFGIFAGFALLWGVWIAFPTRYLGLVTLALSSSSSIALLAYFFMRGLHSWVMYWALGAALGTLFYVIFFPGTMRKMFTEDGYYEEPPYDPPHRPRR